jgi:hypothetical protein
MISDLKLDTIRWYDEMRLSNNRDYKSSSTRRSRQKSGSTPEASPYTITSPPQHPSEQYQSATATMPSSGAQLTFTRQDVEKKVAQRLKDQGYTKISRSRFEKAIDSAMRSLEAEGLAREERAIPVPPPYSSLNHTLDSRSQTLSADILLHSHATLRVEYGAMAGSPVNATNLPEDWRCEARFVVNGRGCQSVFQF